MIFKALVRVGRSCMRSFIRRIKYLSHSYLFILQLKLFKNMKEVENFKTLDFKIKNLVYVFY